MNPAAATQELHEQQGASVDDAQFAKIAEQQQKESAPPPTNFLNAALDESERRAREHIITQAEDFKHKQRLAGLFARSGCFSDVKGKTADQCIAMAFVKMSLGESMGFSEAESMTGVNLISGTPAVSAALRAARMQRAGYSWTIDWFQDRAGVCEGCRLWLFTNGKPVMKQKRDADGNPVLDADSRPVFEQVNVAFMKKDAEMCKTKIWEGYGDKRTSRTASILEKDNWKNTPMNMYFSRAVTNLQRWYAPGVLSGDVPSVDEVLDGSYQPGQHSVDNSPSTTETPEQVRARKVQEAKDWATSHGVRRPEQKTSTNSQTADEQREGNGSSDNAQADGGPTVGTHDKGTTAASNPGPSLISESQGDDLMSLAGEKGMKQADLKTLLAKLGWNTPGAITADKYGEVIKAVQDWQPAPKAPLFSGKGGSK